MTSTVSNLSFMSYYVTIKGDSTKSSSITSNANLSWEHLFFFSIDRFDLKLMKGECMVPTPGWVDVHEEEDRRLEMLDGKAINQKLTTDN